MASETPSTSRRKPTAHIVLLQPTLTRGGIEVSLHTVPKVLRRELVHLFAFDKQVDIDAILVIPTCQRSEVDLVRTGPEADAEKDRLLLSFVEFARDICGQIQAQGYWADYIDPCSGLATFTSNPNKVYSEVDGMQALLHYRVLNAGFCKILLHPKWGSAVYPASMFTTAPPHVVETILKTYIPDGLEPDAAGDGSDVPAAGEPEAQTAGA